VREVALLDPLAVHAHSGGMLKSDRTIARANRKPLEAHVVSCFDALVRALGDLDRPAIDTRLDRQSWRHAFIESYFSNYIERTRVALSEAEEIVFDREVDESRHADSHDILAVYDIAVDTDGMINPIDTRRVPAPADPEARLSHERRPGHAAGLAIQHQNTCKSPWPDFQHRSGLPVHQSPVGRSWKRNAVR
jgi:hypothetical protein